MAEKKERLPFKTAVAYTRRGLSIWWEAAPEVLASGWVREGVDALFPYLPLYFTARLVNAIAGGGDVWIMLAALLASTAAVAAVQAAVHCWDETMRRAHQWPAWNRIFFDKLLSMDFCDIDDPKNQALRTQIDQLRNWGGFGLNRVYRVSAEAIGALCRVLGAVALSVSLFTLPVRPDSALVWLNHPLCLAGVAVLMLLSVALSARLANCAESYWNQYDGTQGNRNFSFFYFVAMRERHRSADIRAYAQDRYFEAGGRANMGGDGSFGPTSSVAKAYRGRAGAFAAASGAVSQVFVGAVYLFAGLKALGGAFGVGSVTQYVGALAGLSKGLSDLLELVEQLTDKQVEFVSQKEAIDTTTPTGKFMLTIFGAVAELEREYILQRQREGIAIAKEKGIYKGRKPIERSELPQVAAQWREGRITAAEAMRRLDMKPSTFYRKVKALP